MRSNLSWWTWAEWSARPSTSAAFASGGASAAATPCWSLCVCSSRWAGPPRGRGLGSACPAWSDLAPERHGVTRRRYGEEDEGRRTAHTHCSPAGSAGRPCNHSGTSQPAPVGMFREAVLLKFKCIIISFFFLFETVSQYKHIRKKQSCTLLVICCALIISSEGKNY